MASLYGYFRQITNYGSRALVPNEPFLIGSDLYVPHLDSSVGVDLNAYVGIFKSTDLGVTWTAQIGGIDSGDPSVDTGLITGQPGFPSRDFLIAVYDGGSTLYLLTNDPGTGNIAITDYTAGGSAFGTTVVTGVAVPDEGMTAFYRASDNSIILALQSGDDAVYVVYDIGSTTASGPTTYSEGVDGTHAANVINVVAGSGTDSILVYGLNTNTGGASVYARPLSSGNVLGSSALVGTSATDDAYACFAASDGTNIAVTWAPPDDNISEIELYKSATGSLSFSGPQLVPIFGGGGGDGWNAFNVCVGTFGIVVCYEQTTSDMVYSSVANYYYSVDSGGGIDTVTPVFAFRLTGSTGTNERHLHLKPLSATDMAINLDSVSFAFDGPLGSGKYNAIGTVSPSGPPPAAAGDYAY